MDLALLPDLVLDRLVDCLHNEDVVRCSMVSSIWRERLNQERYWRKLCLRIHDENFYEFLRGRPCQVKPKFKDPIAEDSTLQLSCQWKLHYMRAKHLERNLEQGQYVIRDINPAVNDKRNLLHKEYMVDNTNGDVVYVFINDDIELWNVSGEPYRIGNIKNALGIDFLHDTKFIQFIMNKRKLVIFRRFIFQVYNLTADGFVLQYRRLIHRPEIDSVAIPDTEIIKDWCACNKIDDQVHVYQCKVFQHLFVLVYADYVTACDKLCVWNLETGKRESTALLVPESEVLYSSKALGIPGELYHSSNMEHIFYTFNYRNHVAVVRSHVFQYCLRSGETKCIATFRHVSDVRMLKDNLLVTLNRSEVQLLVHDTSTENNIFLKTIPVNYYPKVCAHDHYLVICSGLRDTYLTNIVIIHLQTLETLSSFNITFTGTPRLELIQGDILIISCGTLDIWNWRKQVKLYSLPRAHNTRLFKNEHVTQLYGNTDNNNKLCIIHFW